MAQNIEAQPENIKAILDLATAELTEARQMIYQIMHSLREPDEKDRTEAETVIESNPCDMLTHVRKIEQGLSDLRYRTACVKELLFG